MPRLGSEIVFQVHRLSSEPERDMAKCVDGREDAVAVVAFFGMLRDFDVAGFNSSEAGLLDEVHVDCEEPICKVLHARLHVLVFEVGSILVSAIEIFRGRFDGNDYDEWIGRATFEGCDCEERDGDLDHGRLLVGLGRSACFLVLFPQSLFWLIHAR